MTLKYKILLVSSAVVSAFAWGRLSVQSPTIKTVVDSTLKTAVTDRDTHKETTTVTEKQPSGEIKTTTRIVEDTVIKRESDAIRTTHLDQAVTSSKVGTLNISALVGMDLSTLKPVYGASVSKQILGPISIGAFGLTNGSVGASLGVTF